MLKLRQSHCSQMRTAGLPAVLLIIFSMLALVLSPMEGALAGALYDTDALTVYVAADGTCEGTPCYTTIQAGVNAVEIGGTVRVEAGNYPEFVVVNKAVTLRGPNFGDSPTDTGLTPRGAGEAVVMPPYCQDITVNTVVIGSTDLYQNLFTVLADNVVIDGFTLNGYSATLEANPTSGCKGYTSDGVHVYAGGGVANGYYHDGFGATYQPSAVTVRNNIIQNFNLYGVALGSNTDAGRGNHVIWYNVFDNTIGNPPIPDFVPAGVPAWGNRRAIALRQNQYASVKGNLITRAAYGVDVNDYTGNPAGSLFEVSDNDITSVQKGIWAGRLQNGTLPLTIANNDLRTDASSATNTALDLELTWETVLLTVSGNAIFENAQVGIQLFSVTIPSGLTIQNTTVAATTRAGIEIINQDDAPTANGPMKVTLDNVDITGGPTGIYVNDSTAAPANATLTVTIANGSSVVGAAGSNVALQILGPDAAVTIANSSFTGGAVGIQVKDGGVLSGVNNSIIGSNSSHGIQIVDNAGQPGKINGNNLAGNGGDAINNATAYLVDASANWWGTNNAGLVASEVVGGVDYTPWLNDATNTVTVGFLSNYAWLWVDDITNSQTTWINEALGYVASGGKVSVLGGTYNEAVALNKNASLDFDSDTTISGGINQSLGTILAPNETLTLQGSFERSGGVFTHNSGTVAMAGLSAQTLGGAAATTFNNLTLDNPFGISMGGPVTVNGALSLSGAVFNLGANTLTLGAAASVVPGEAFSATNLATTGSGAFCKQFSAPGAFTFPLGENTGTVNYSPMVLTLTGGTYSGASVCVTVTDAVYPGNTAVNKLSRYWTVTSSGITGGSADTQFTYSTDQEDIGSASETVMAGLKFVSGNSVPVDDGPLDESGNSFQLTGLTGLTGVYTAGNPAPTLATISITLTRLTSTSNRISWAATGEGATLRYQVLRSSTTNSADAVAISPQIPMNAANNGQYSWDDTGRPVFTNYYYWLSVSEQSTGNEHIYGPYLLNWLKTVLPLLLFVP